MEKYQEQLLDYSFREGIELAVLSNGTTWSFYLPTERGRLETRRRVEGQGKSGGVRIIYYWQTAFDRIYFLTIYAKNEMSDLSAAEKKALKKLVEGLGNG